MARCSSWLTISIAALELFSDKGVGTYLLRGEFLSGVQWQMDNGIKIPLSIDKSGSRPLKHTAGLSEIGLMLPSLAALIILGTLFPRESAFPSKGDGR